ncbi:MAG: hypothetical protein Q7J51_08215 [Sheuella sp.]|jgi:hypothetical protein|nr:hypothetical protein [Sheuella sp.]
MSDKSDSFIDNPVEGPAFPLLVKVMATALMLAMVYWGAGAEQQIIWREFSSGAAVLFGGALLITVVAYVWILKSRTSIDAQAIEQTWIWKRRVLLADITQAKFIYVPYLSWLIAPRLIVRAGPGVSVFYSASPQVQRVFARLMSGK